MAEDKEIIRGLQATLMVDNKEVIRNLQATLGRMEIALGAIREAILWTSEEGTVTWCNKSFDTMVGLPHISILGAKVEDVFPLENESGPISFDQHPCQILQKAPFLDDTTYIFRSGEKSVSLEISGSSIEISSANKFVILTIHDISALKLSQKELKKAKEDLEIKVQERTADLLELNIRYQNILIEAVDGIITIDTEGIIKSFNPAAEKIFGYSKTEVLGKNVKLLMPSPERENHDRYIQNYLESGTKHIIGIGREVVGLRRDGSEVPLELAVSESVAKDTRLFTGLLRDISKRIEAENALREAKYEAENANRLKSDFLARMSHEIRTPMNSIMGMAELLQESSLSHDQGKYVDVLRSSSTHLLSIINDILDLAKIEAGKFQLETVPFDLHKVFSDTYDILSVTASKKELKLDFSIASGTPVKLQGDPLRLKQILINIVGNAIKFTEQGEVTFKASRGAAGGINVNSHPKINLQFEVRDTGIGIEEADLKEIFDSFTQTEHSLSRKFEGTGLGLAIARKLVSFMGGDLSVSSALDEGSTFSFDGWFLTDEQVEDNVALSTSALEHGEKSYALSGELKILLVEDSPDNRFLFETFLKQLNCTVDFAENGMTGYEKFTSSAYDLILMDIQMPVLDGYSATKLIRSYEKMNKLARTPVIALSAHARAEEKEESLQAGCDLHVSKPIGKNELLSAICGLLNENDPAENHSEQKESSAHKVYIDKLIEDLIPGFLNNRRDDINKLREAVDRTDMEALANLGHTLKGTGGGYGFEKISEIGKEIEHAAQRNEPTIILQLTSELEIYLDTLEVVFVD